MTERRCHGPSIGGNVDTILLKVVIIAVILGMAELLPISRSAHVVIAEKLMGLRFTGRHQNAIEWSSRSRTL